MSVPKRDISEIGTCWSSTKDLEPHVMGGVDPGGTACVTYGCHKLSNIIAVLLERLDIPTAAFRRIGLNVKPDCAIGATT